MDGLGIANPKFYDSVECPNCGVVWMRGAQYSCNGSHQKVTGGACFENGAHIHCYCVLYRSFGNGCGHDWILPVKESIAKAEALYREAKENSPE